MNFLKRLTLAYHVIAGLFLLTLLALFLLRWMSLGAVLDFVYVSYADEAMRVVWTVVFGVSLVFNYMLFRVLIKGNIDHQVIRFDNPSGKVRVSIFALEELAKRVACSVEEVKSVQAKVALASKGLDVDLKMVLCSDANILEVTSRVQNVVRRRLQETISVDQAVNVSAYVSKIDPVVVDAKAIKGTLKNPYTDIHVPFKGYRA